MNMKDKMNGRIMVVDDLQINRQILSEILSDDYEVIEAGDGITAIEMLTCNDGTPMPDVILLDIMMPGMDGYEVLSALKDNPSTKGISVLFITALDDEDDEQKGLKAGAVDFIQKPFNPDIVKARIDNHVELQRYKNTIEKIVEEKTEHLVDTHERMLETLATIIEYRSLESGSHIRRICGLTKILIECLLKKPMFEKELVAQEHNMIVKASALHDIGKIGIPDAVLLKPGRLTSAEFDVIKTHSVIGGDIIDSLDITGSEMYLKHCRDICRHHHERWDGTGYPDKLKGEEIPLSARIVAIVDVYDALVSKRCYRPEFSLNETYGILKSGSGTQFQPEIVDALFEVHNKFERLEVEMTDR